MRSGVADRSELDAAGEAEAGHDSGGAAQVAFELLGIGRVPLGVILTSWNLLFGALGLAVSFLSQRSLGATASLVVAIAVASGGELGLTGQLARLVARWLPSAESCATSSHELVGSLGCAELAVASKFGVANVNAPDGSLLKGRCVSANAPIEKGEPVLLIDFDAERCVYVVEPRPAVLGPSALRADV